MATLREKAIEVATGEIGVREVPLGSNWGPRVSEYIKRTGYTTPGYWCLCFQYWAVDEAAKALSVANPLPRTGSCDLLLTWANKGDHLVSKPQAGDLFLVMATSTDAIHTGMVTGLVDEHTLETVEGNSNTDGSSNGIAVVKRHRTIRKLKFVRWAEANTELQLVIGGHVVCELTNQDGVCYAPARLVTQKLGLDPNKIGWDSEDQAITYDGLLIQAGARIINGVGNVPVRALAGFFGLVADVNMETKLVTLRRP
jgi:hypothetical protein